MTPKALQLLHEILKTREMRFRKLIDGIARSLPRTVAAVGLSLLALAPAVVCQTQTPSPSPQSDDVLRINTELVQTDVMVFDKKGSFVTGLKPEQFELTVEGKSQPISFFEQVRAGSAKEVQLLSKEKAAPDS